ncbi:MAG: tetratricopeptide repeat protein [Actinobacteria bacterium]|nr:tetratricopeptide repeat protein [Actinomycetota bacterium]
MQTPTTAPRRGVLQGLVPTLVLLAVVAIPVIGFLTFRAEPTAVPAPAPVRSVADRTVVLEERTAADPGDLEAWQGLAVAYTQRAAIEGDPAFYALAERALERAEELGPDAPMTILARGNLELSLHRFADARRTAERAVVALPASAEAHGLAVDAAAELGDYAAAAESLQTMLDLDPGLPALARASYLRELHGDLAGAITAMQQAEQAGSAVPGDRAAVTSLLGDLHRRGGDLSAAEGAYTRALDAVPDFVPAQLGLIRISAVRTSPAAAAEELAALVDELPRLDAVLLLADLREAAGDAEGRASALELARAMAALQQDAGQVVDLELALLEADHGDPDVAVELATAAFESRPDNIYAADALAWALHRAGRSDEAGPIVERALRLDTADPLLRFHAAAVTAAGDEDRARALLTSALELDPWFSFALLDELRELADRLDVPVPAAAAT